LNLPHYPSSVEQLVVLEPDGAMRRRMAARAAEAPVPVEVLPQGIDASSLPGAGFDTVVCVLVLCTVPDLERALAQVGRLLADGGRLLFLEHVGSVGVRGRLQRLVTPLWRRLAAGCHLDRDVPAAIRASGLAITDVEWFGLPLPRPLSVPAVQGVARPRRHSTADFRARLASPRDTGGSASATAAEAARA
ncbi:MAG TPA: methyltransferase domain-containing protein, partial [Acidimicrobiales bacterium]|nr:methyltransferase domain-containing protein [Acidimicrobiales bacterium]